MTEITTNGIAAGLKVAVRVSDIWIFQDDKKDNIEIIIEKVLHIPGLTIRLICPQQVKNQKGYIGYDLHVEKDEGELIFWRI